MFIDQAGELGVAFRHDPGLSGHLYMPEILGAGAALFDADGDGDLDLLLVQSQVAEPASAAAGSRLFRNEWVETGSLNFVDVTAQSGLHTRCYGTGVTAGDIDNDGDIDLYLTCWGANELWRNEGGLRFVEIGAQSGTDDPSWTGTANFFDFDGDGLLDLYVGNYLEYSPAIHKDCRAASGKLDYCGPLTHSPAPDRLLHNQGNGRFADVSGASGMASGTHAPALGVVASDFNGDGRLDLYVANDAYANGLWIQQADRRFVDEALLAGAAVNVDGQPEASMGLDAGDYDGDGDDDLIMAHLADEKATLYAAVSPGLFEDRTLPSGLGQITRGYTGFGAAWIDYDNDGWLDFMVVNGRVRMDPAQIADAASFPYAQTMLLLRNQGDGKLSNVSARSGAVFAEERVSRGAAFGDLDNDGDLDVVVNNANDQPFVLINQIGQAQAWAGVRLVDYGRDAQGARAIYTRSDGRKLARRVRVDGSYASANDPRLLFALGQDAKLGNLDVVWADGGRERFASDRLQAGGYTELTRGSGEAPAP